MVVTELNDTFCIWVRDNGLGQVVATTEENGRTEYLVVWLDAKDPTPTAYGDEDIEEGSLVLLKGNPEAILILYGQKS